MVKKRKIKGTNLYLNPETKSAAIEVAKTRYGRSLSELVTMLLAREVALKRGLLAKRAA